jgi:hypothetical protein
MTAIIIPKLQRKEPSTKLLLAATPSGLPQESTVTVLHHHGPIISNACIKKGGNFLKT